MNDELSFLLTLKKTNKNTIYMWRVSDLVEYVALGFKMLPGQSSSGAQGN